MRERAQRAAVEAQLSDRVEIREGVYEALPVESSSVDVVLSNGVVNLAPDKSVVFSEVARVLRPGGRLLLADVVVQRELSLKARADEDLWAACIAGALYEPELFELANVHGFENARIVRRFDAFGGTSAGEKVSKDLFVTGVAFVATKRQLRG
jgi:SAM-dependent methyltransferase